LPEKWQRVYSEDTKQITGIIIQARMASSRFPGKILEEILPGVSMLDYLVHRLRTCRFVDECIVATTTNPKDDELVAHLIKEGVAYYRGSEDDCVARYHGACHDFGIETILRITSDCPMVLPEVVDDMVQYYRQNMQWVDYLSNRQFTNFPEGLDIEIFSSKLIEEAMNEADQQDEREHINYFFLRRPSRYRLRYFNHSLGMDLSRFKLSVDTKEDLSRLQHLFQKGLHHQFSFKQLTEVLSAL